MSLRTKIILGVLLIVLFLTLILSARLYVSLNIRTEQEVRNNLLLNTRQVSSSINMQNEIIETSLQGLAELVLQDFDYGKFLNEEDYLSSRVEEYFDYAKHLLKFLHESNLGVMSLYVDYNVEVIPEHNYDIWFVIRDDVVVLEDSDVYLLSDYYPENPEMEWYFLPKLRGEPVWTSVYEDTHLEIKMVSYVIPLIFERSNFVGLVGVDIGLDLDKAYLEAVKGTSLGDVVILDENHEVIVGSPNIISPDLMSEYKKQNVKEGFVKGKDQLLFFEELDNNHKVLSVISNSYIEDQKRLILRNVLVALFILLSAFGFLAFLFSKRITRSLKELRRVSEEMRKGNFNVRAEVLTKDELGDLATSFNKAAEELSLIEDERKRLEKAKTEFLSITSHELRSPMTPMKAQLQMLKKGFFGKMSEKQKKSVEVVLRNTERLDKIIVDFLDISRIEAARMKFNFVKTDLNELIDLLIMETKGFMPEKKIVFVKKVEKPLVIETDPERISQVLRNLLNNAVKFSNEKGKIEVFAKKDKGEVLFYVKDEGVGIKRHSQNRIFEPFFQADNMYQHKSGGTGLGLAISKGIVNSQRGKIWFTSEDNKGTTFYFTLPLKPVKDIKPIKVLFSSKALIENKIKKAFLEVLGPIGEIEFEDQRLKGFVKEDLLEYVDYLKEKKIIYKTEEFKNKIIQAFNLEDKN